MIELLMSVLILGLLMTSLYAGISYGFTAMRLANENLRATQIIIQKIEELRLCNWTQLTSPQFVPTTFVASYYPNGNTNDATLLYTGTIRLEQPPAAEIGGGYANDILVASIRLSWTFNGVQRTRRADTYFSRYGMQNYIFN
jgi:type II secretory pathway pseudopilin PulG